MQPIIEVKDVWKSYRRGRAQESYLTIADRISAAFRPKAKKESFWALEGVEFSLEAGDSLAIVGRNGAGKSTLLKVLSRITPPTKGEIILRGRLASLLEVGTGFHGELTGRENIYLNGSILGLSREEINAKFDEIVDFSGVEKFLETPLKHYSSGMQLRLAFAVAANLEPEILVIDEVLAVGDSAFQQKCIQKMTEVSRSGRTILFVSHNLQAVKNLCQKGILLESGKMVASGPVEEILTKYTSQEDNMALNETINLKEAKRVSGAGDLRFKHIRCLNGWKKQAGETITFDLELENLKKLRFNDLLFGLMLRDRDDQSVIHLSNHFVDKKVVSHEKGTTYRFQINENPLRSGAYRLILFLRADEEIQDWIEEDIFIEIVEGNRYGFPQSSMIQGLIQPAFNFEMIK